MEEIRLENGQRAAMIVRAKTGASGRFSGTPFEYIAPTSSGAYLRLNILGM